MVTWANGTTSGRTASTFDVSVYYPEEYGTVTDGGLVDCSAAFQAASDAATAAGGGIVRMRTPGLYACKEVDLRSGVTWLSDPGVKYVYFGSTIEKHCFSIGDFSSSTFSEDVAFIGGEFDFSSIGGGVTNLHCIRVYSVKRWRVENVKATQSDYGSILHVSRGSGLYNLNSVQGYVNGLSFTGATNDNYGCFQINACDQLTVENIYGDAGIQIRVETDGQSLLVRGITVHNVTTTGTGRPMSLTCHDTDITDVLVDGIWNYGTQSGIEFWTESGTRKIKNVTIKNFHFTQSRFWRQGQDVYDSVEGLVVENGIIEGTSDNSTRPALSVCNGTFRNILVRDCTGAAGGVGSLWGTDTSPNQKVLMENIRVVRCTGPAFRHDVSAVEYVHVNCEAIDDSDLRGPSGDHTLTGELLTLNQQGIETDTTGFSTVSNASMARDTGVFRTGTASLKHTLTTTGSNSTIATTAGVSGFAVTPATIYTVQAYAITGTETREVRVEMRWYDSGGAVISTSTGGYYAANNTYWTHVHNSFTAPALSAFGAVRFTINGTAAVSGEFVYWDDLSVKTGGAQQTMTYALWGHATKSRLISVNSRYNAGTSGRFNAIQNDRTFSSPRGGEPGYISRVIASTATAGAATLPANPVGFVTVNILGTDRKIPYYAT